MNTARRRFAAAVMVSLGLACVGITPGAYADPPPQPPPPPSPWPSKYQGYYWCPGNPFDPAWGPNWDPTTCHDAHHRDRDGTITSGDYYGPSPFH